MAMSKELPSELRRAADALNTGTVHGDLRNYTPVAGPSGSQQNFRSSSSTALQERDLGQSAFQDFANQSANAAVKPDQEASYSSSRLHFTEEDLSPRPEDSAAVMALFEKEDEEDTLEGVSEEVSSRQALSWHDKQDSIIPQDPAPAHVVHSPEATYTSSDYPYLFDLLSLPEDESISSYLNEHTYTDDVWGLPMAIKQDLDAIKAPTTDDAARERALRRLAMLKTHLTGSTQAQTKANGARVISDSDWESIWTRQGV